MPTVIVYPATPPQVANAYQSVADVTARLDALIHGAPWNDVGSEDRKRIVITATTILERQRYGGERVSATQDLAFPRTGLLDIDGAAISSATIPEDVLKAHAELCLALAEDQSVASGRGSSQNVESISTSRSSVSFFQDTQRRPTDLPDAVRQSIGHLFASRYVSMGASYGTDEDDNESQFEDREAHDRSEPFG